MPAWTDAVPQLEPAMMTIRNRSDSNNKCRLCPPLTAARLDCGLYWVAAAACSTVAAPKPEYSLPFRRWRYLFLVAIPAADQRAALREIDHGWMFVACGKSFAAFEVQLARMVGAEDGIADALFGFTRPISGAYFWCPPMSGGYPDLSALGCWRERPTPQAATSSHAPPPARRPPQTSKIARFGGARQRPLAQHPRRPEVPSGDADSWRI